MDAPNDYPASRLPPTAATDERPVGLLTRVKVAAGLLAGLGRHDLRAARSLMNLMWPNAPRPMRLLRFAGWGWRQMFEAIPEAMRHVTWARQVCRTPIWLAEPNPLENHPWAEAPDVRLPESADVVVIGAGFTGAAAAYHWARQAPAGRTMVVLDMGEAAGGASGRNEGLVVMGRYYHMVHGTVLPHLRRTLTHLSGPECDRLAHQFARAYCKAAYKNADLIEQTVAQEGFDCNYHRNGWVQDREPADQAELEESVRQGHRAGFDDWIKIPPAEALARTGMTPSDSCGFSQRAATFHPAKWVWSLLTTALQNSDVRFFSRTRVVGVEDAGEQYLVRTDRGAIRAEYVLNATESYTTLLHGQFRNRLFPVQTQAAFGQGGPEAMKPNVGISGKRGFWGRHDGGTMIGSDATRVPDSQAGQIRPSRFITKYLCAELKRHFGPYRLHLTHEWSGTVGYTPDEFPVVGLIDGKRQYLIGGMAGSGSAVSFNAARWTCQRILGLDGPDDYPQEYFSPTRLLDPQNHVWPKPEATP